MLRRASILATLLALLLGGTAFAEGLLSKPLVGGHCAKCCCDTPPFCCPNDYCRKPLPCPPCPAQLGCCDTYCRKPLPCPPCPVQLGCCDTYCPKPYPDLCRPRDWQYYRCPPAEGCCGKK